MMSKENKTHEIDYKQIQYRGGSFLVMPFDKGEVFSREDFRQNSYVSSISLGVISGFGHEGYLMALDALSSLNK